MGGSLTATLGTAIQSIVKKENSQEIKKQKCASELV